MKQKSHPKIAFTPNIVSVRNSLHFTVTQYLEILLVKEIDFDFQEMIRNTSNDIIIMKRNLFVTNRIKHSMQKQL